MKILIVNPYSCCASRHEGAGFNLLKLTEGGASSCGMDPHQLTQASFYEDHSCLIGAVPLGERFFFRATRREHGGVTGTASFWGHMIKDSAGDIFLEMEKHISSDMSMHRPNHYWLETYSPDTFFLQNTDNQALLTSDGVIILEDDNFLGSKGGSLEEFTPDDVLASLSRGKSLTSPTFESLRLKPVSRRPQNVRTGTVIFNDVSKKIEYYNGTEWKKL